MSKKLLVVDGSSIAVTRFYAMGGGEVIGRELVPYEELLTLVTEVAAETLTSIQNRVRMDGFDEVRIALESPPEAPQWRYKTYPAYKHANRAEGPLRVASALQVPLIRAAEAAGIRTLFSPTNEADDVIGIMIGKSSEWLSEGNHIYIWSHDKDLHQLVTDPGIFILGKAGKILTRADIIDQWGAEPQAIPLIKALAGDKSDNIPGIRGIGPKKAAAMLRKVPHRKPNGFWIDDSKIPEALRNEVVQLKNRIKRDEQICTIKTTFGLLYDGEHYEDISVWQSKTRRPKTIQQKTF